MNDELKKCLSGEWYDCHAPVFIEFKKKTHRLLLKYNALPYESREERRAVLKEMFGSIGEKVSVGNPFVCDCVFMETVASGSSQERGLYKSYG